MHSVRLEPTKMILIGTRITYQATGDAGISYGGQTALLMGAHLSLRTCIHMSARQLSSRKIGITKITSRRDIMTIHSTRGLFLR